MVDVVACSVGQGQGPSHFTASCLLLRHACCSSLHCTREHRLGDGGSAVGPAARGPEHSYHSRRKDGGVCASCKAEGGSGLCPASPSAPPFFSFPSSSYSSLLSASSFSVSSVVPTRSLIPILSPHPSPPHPVTTIPSVRNSYLYTLCQPKGSPQG